MMANRAIGLWVEGAQACFKGTPWYGPALWEVLGGIDATEAVMLPKGANNSVASLVHHLAAWYEFALRKVAGDTNFDIPLNTIADWPPSQIQNTADWQALKDKLASRHSELLRRVAEKSDDWLDAPVPGRLYPFRYLLDGIIQHNTYHLGQITLVWKLAKANTG